jgi:GGDEF domain-containing protein
MVAAMLITRNIAGSVDHLMTATKQIAEGKFDNVPTIKNRDELGELSSAFGEMAKRLKRLEEMYLDASPLTRLPGGIAIENLLRKRLAANAPMAFCLLDIDNFKSFNDRYGYARGSDVIQATARIIEEVVAGDATDDEFVGHIGGDDFVIITTPDRCTRICSAVIEEFDKAAPNFYSPEDRARGYIMGKTRQGQTLAFPIVSLSVAVVTNTNRTLTNHLEVGELAAELKDYAKSIPGSIYVMDHRRKYTVPADQTKNVIHFPKIKT